MVVHDDETLDGSLHVHQTVSYGLKKFVESTHLLYEDCIHALLIRGRIYLQRTNEIEVSR